MSHNDRTLERIADELRTANLYAAAATYENTDPREANRYRAEALHRTRIPGVDEPRHPSADEPRPAAVKSNTELNAIAVLAGLAAAAKARGASLEVSSGHIQRSTGNVVIEYLPHLLTYRITETDGPIT